MSLSSSSCHHSFKTWEIRHPSEHCDSVYNTWFPKAALSRFHLLLLSFTGLTMMFSDMVSLYFCYLQVHRAFWICTCFFTQFRKSMVTISSKNFFYIFFLFFGTPNIVSSNTYSLFLNKFNLSNYVRLSNLEVSIIIFMYLLMSSLNIERCARILPIN